MANSDQEHANQSLSLFDNDEEVPIRELNREAAMAELKLKVDEVRQEMKRLDEAETVTQDILETEVSV